MESKLLASEDAISFTCIKVQHIEDMIFVKNYRYIFLGQIAFELSCFAHRSMHFFHNIDDVKISKRSMKCTHMYTLEQNRNRMTLKTNVQNN